MMPWRQHLPRVTALASLFLVPVLSARELQAAPTGRLEVLAAEIDRLSPVLDGSARPENLALATRLRQILGEVGQLALGNGEEARPALDLLAATTHRSKRNVAMEAVLALFGMRGDAGMTTLISALPGLETAVRRQTIELLLTRKHDLARQEAGILAALKVDTDVEARSSLVKLAEVFDGLTVARALLDAVVKAPASARQAEPDGRVAAQVVASLSALKAPDVTTWLAREAFTATVARPQDGAQRLEVLLAVVARRQLDAARPSVEALLVGADERVAIAALRTLGSLGPGPSRRSLEQAAAVQSPHPRLAAQAALALGSVEDAAGLKALCDLSTAGSWQHRREAATALGELAQGETSFLRVLKLLDDTNREVRSAAFLALRKFHRQEAVTAAVKQLEALGRNKALALGYLEWLSGRTPLDEAQARAWWQQASRGELKFPPAGPVRAPERDAQLPHSFR